MTEEQYRRYLEDTYGEDFHLYEDIYNEGLGQAISNGVQKVKTWWNGVQNNKQNNANMKTNDLAQKANTVAAKAPTSEENLTAAFNQIAMDIINVQKGGLFSGQKQANKVQKKADKAAAEEAKKAEAEAAKAKDVADGDELTAKLKGDGTPIVNEATHYNNLLVGHFFEELAQGSLSELLGKYGLSGQGQSPKDISSFLNNLYNKAPDKLKSFLGELQQSLGKGQAKHVANALKAIETAEQQKANKEKQDQMLNGADANAGGDNVEGPAAGADTNAGGDNVDGPAAGADAGADNKVEEPAVNNDTGAAAGAAAGGDSKVEGPAAGADAGAAADTDQEVQEEVAVASQAEKATGVNTDTVAEFLKSLTQNMRVSKRKATLDAATKEIAQIGYEKKSRAKAAGTPKNESKLISQFLYKYYN